MKRRRSRSQPPRPGPAVKHGIEQVRDALPHTLGQHESQIEIAVFVQIHEPHTIVPLAVLEDRSRLRVVRVDGDDEISDVLGGDRMITGVAARQTDSVSSGRSARSSGVPSPRLSRRGLPRTGGPQHVSVRTAKP